MSHTLPRPGPPGPAPSGAAALFARAALAALLGLVPAGCDDGHARTTRETRERPPTGPVAQEIRDLVTAMTPLPADAPIGERNAWFPRRKETLERLRAAGPEVGRAALERYHESDDARVEVRIGLLDVAAHNVPEATEDLLVELVTTYGEDLHLRTKACTFLGLTSPERAVEVLEPIVVRTTHSVTYPPDDRLVEAWSTAATRLGLDRAPVLADIATDLSQSQEARHLAARLLGEIRSPVGRQALETVLVESSGNNYLRRVAAQSLQKTVSAEDFCATVRKTAENEADPSFAAFLASMLDKHCR